MPETTAPPSPTRHEDATAPLPPLLAGEDDDAPAERHICRGID